MEVGESVFLRIKKKRAPFSADIFGKSSTFQGPFSFTDDCHQISSSQQTSVTIGFSLTTSFVALDSDDGKRDSGA